MPDQEAQGATPEAPDATPEPQPQTSATEELGPAGKAALDKERQARREAERQRAELEGELRKLAAEHEGRTQRVTELERRIAELERTAAEHALRASTIEVAARLGFRDPSDAYRLIDPAAIEYDGDAPRNVGDILAELARQKPYLLRGEPTPVGSADQGRQGRSTANRIYSRDELKDPKFFEEHRDDIFRAMAEGRIST